MEEEKKEAIIEEREMPPADEHPEFILPPNDITKKAKYVENGGVTPEALEAAETAIKKMKPEYEKWLQDDIIKLNQSYQNLDERRTPEAMQEVFEIVHDMKGQGGSFDYQLITLIGNKLCRIIEARLMIKDEPINDLDMEMTKAHIHALIYVVNNRLQGFGGQEGETLLRGFDSVMNKFFKHYGDRLPKKTLIQNGILPPED